MTNQTPSSLQGIDLDGLEKIAREATQREWSWRLGAAGEPDQWCLGPGILMADGPNGTPSGDSLDRANAKHIATFDPPTVLSLIQALRQGSHGWRTIESAPKDGTDVLTFSPRAADYGFNPSRLNWFANGTWQKANSSSWPATHWMPLPLPPAQDGEGR